MGWDGYPSRSFSEHTHNYDRGMNGVDLTSEDRLFLRSLSHLYLSGNLLDYYEQPQIGGCDYAFRDYTTINPECAFITPDQLAEAAKQIHSKLRRKHGFGFQASRKWDGPDLLADGIEKLCHALSIKGIGLIPSY